MKDAPKGRLSFYDKNTAKRKLIKLIMGASPPDKNLSGFFVTFENTFITGL